MTDDGIALVVFRIIKRKEGGEGTITHISLKWHPNLTLSSILLFLITIPNFKEKHFHCLRIFKSSDILYKTIVPLVLLCCISTAQLSLKKGPLIPFI